MRHTIVLGIAFLIFFLFPHISIAEPKRVANFDNWEVWEERSIIDNSIERAFCVAQSKNTIKSQT